MDKKDYDDYKRILNQTIISSCLSEEEKNNRYRPLVQYLNRFFPLRLFKYRYCSENHMEAFLNDQMWAATAEKMNDAFDARLFFNKKDVIENFKQKTSFESVECFIEKLKTDESLQKYITRIPGGQEMIEYAFLPNDYLKYGIEESKKIITDIIESMNDALNIITQQTIMICSFSETINSAYMWGQYADNEQGFCIEYRFDNPFNIFYSSNAKTALGFIYPVTYSENRYQVPAEYIEYLIQYRMFFDIFFNLRPSKCIRDIHNSINNLIECPDISVITKIALHKSAEWQYEREWRLILNSMTGQLLPPSGAIAIIQKPAALYLGRRISQLNEKILKRFAEEKNIPVYKMKPDDESSTYELLPELISD